MAALLDTNFDDHTLRTVNARQAQMLVGAVVIILALTMVVAALALRKRAAVPVYVVAIDRQTGEILGTAHPVAASPALSAEITREVIERFIEDSRGITNNIDLERDRLTHVYSVARGQALKAIDAWYHQDDAHNAMKEALANKWTEVEIVRCLRQPEPDTWLVEWREQSFQAHSQISTTSDWQASVRTATTQDGIFIIDLDWQKSADTEGATR